MANCTLGVGDSTGDDWWKNRGTGDNWDTRLRCYCLNDLEGSGWPRWCSRKKRIVSAVVVVVVVWLGTGVSVGCFTLR